MYICVYIYTLTHTTYHTHTYVYTHIYIWVCIVVAIQWSLLLFHRNLLMSRELLTTLSSPSSPPPHTLIPPLAPRSTAAVAKSEELTCGQWFTRERTVAVCCNVLQRVAVCFGHLVYLTDSITNESARQTRWLQHTATLCNTLQHTATRCNRALMSN